MYRYCSARILQLNQYAIEFQDISVILSFSTISFITHLSTLCNGRFIVMALHVFFETPCGEQPKTHFTVCILPMVTESLSMQRHRDHETAAQVGDSFVVFVVTPP